MTMSEINVVHVIMSCQSAALSNALLPLACGQPSSSLSVHVSAWTDEVNQAFALVVYSE
jgi:hypothetical protein